ncbi:MAG TPA: hypothetical protein DHW02_16425 [Ktedonobacter sp.]|nr:hypothetical protein [Ktedonobacter sp.]
MKTLRQVLTTFTDEQLASILRLWVVNEQVGTKKATSRAIDALLLQMQDTLASRFVWEKLSPDARIILYRAVSSSANYGIAHDDLRKKAQVPAANYQSAIAELMQEALLQETENPFYYALSTSSSSPKTHATVIKPFSESVNSLNRSGRELFAPNGDRSKKKLSSLLTQATDYELTHMLRGYGIEQNGYYARNDLRDLLVERMIDDDNILAHTALDEWSHTLVKKLMEADGKMTMQTVRETMHLDDVALLSILRTLESHAIAFDTFSGGKRVLFIPNDLYMSMLPAARAKKAFVKEEKAELVQATDEPTIVRSSEPVTVYDVATLVGAIYQQRIEPTQAGRVPKRIAAKIRPLLRGQTRYNYTDEDEYLEILLDVMRQFGLITLAEPDTDQSKAAYIPQPFLEQWGAFPLLSQISRLARFWLDNASWQDVYGVHYKPTNAYIWNAKGGRDALIRQLAACTPNRWYTISSLLDVLWDKDAYAFRPQNSFYPPKLSRKTSENRAIWDLCEGEVYTGILASTLNELGIVSVGYSQSGQAGEPLAEQTTNPDVFMVTDLGDKVLKVGAGQADVSLLEQESSTGNALVIQPNFELLFLQPDLGTLYKVLPFAQVNQLGLVSRLTLTKASVIRGLTSGKTIEQILATLRDCSQKGLPQNVEYTLLDWVKSYRDVSISQVLLLEVSNEDVIPRLKAMAPLKELVTRQLGPTMLAVQGEVDMAKLRKALEKEGIVVRVNGDIFVRPKQNRYYGYDYPTYDRY